MYSKTWLFKAKTTHIREEWESDQVSLVKLVLSNINRLIETELTEGAIYRLKMNSQKSKVLDWQKIHSHEVLD